MCPRLLTLLLFVSLVCCQGSVAGSGSSTTITPGGSASENPCLHSSPILEWTSKLRVENIPFGTNDGREENHQVASGVRPPGKRKRRMKGRGSVQLLIQGHNRTTGKINAQTRYQVELMNFMARGVSALLLVTSVNHSSCGLGIMTSNGSEDVTETGNSTNSCYLIGETFLPTRAKEAFAFVSPGCGCLNISVHFAYRANNKIIVGVPKNGNGMTHIILCVTPIPPKAERVAEVERRTARQRKAKLRRKRRKQRQNRTKNQFVDQALRNHSSSSIDTGTDLETPNERETEASNENFNKDTIKDAEVILHQIYNEEENELKSLNEADRGGEEEGESYGGEEEEDDDEEENDESEDESDETSEENEDEEESDETSESEENDESEDGQENQNGGEESSSSGDIEESHSVGNGKEDKSATKEGIKHKDEEETGNQHNNRKVIGKRRNNARRLRVEKLRGGGGGRKRRINKLKARQKGKRNNYFKGSRLCCRQGIKHKKLIVYKQLQNNTEFTEGCDEAPLELLTWAKENFKVSEGFCSRRFAQCCFKWRPLLKENGPRNFTQNTGTE